VRTLLLLAVAVGAAALGLVAWSSDVLRRPEHATVDARFGVRGAQAPPADVVVVGLDAESLRRLNVQPPIPRSIHARVIDRLRAAGARVVAYDFEFAQPTSVREDNALIRAVARAGSVVLAATRIAADGDVDVFDGAENVRRARAVAGSTNFPPAAARGGVIRRVPYAERGVRSFAVAAAERARGTAVDPRPFSGDGAWIDFAGPPGTIPAFPLHRVVAGAEPPGGFAGKVVVVGATASVLQDVHAVATGPGMPGAEIHANAIATILRGVPLGEVAGWLAALAPLAALRLQGLRWLPVPLVAAAAYAVAAQLSFDAGTIVPVAAPALALAAGVAGTFAVAYGTDLRDRRRLRAAFARFVPPQVVDEVVAQAGEGARLGGVERESTVLFCDLRSFTTLAERLGPARVIDLLTCYLTAMSDAIMDHGGTVVSYQGDGIMAVFGAPLPQPDHADRALAAAADMLGPRLEQVNAQAREVGVLTAADAPLRIGIGIASGPVMSGNVGSPRRMEYTAVGDTTNTAARLQAMTKETGCPVLVADVTRASLRGPEPPLRRVGELALRGRSAPLIAWTFGGGEGSPAAPDAAPVAAS
jgi:adenylate cyclase